MAQSVLSKNKMWIWAGCIGFWAIVAIILAAILNDRNIIGNTDFYFLVSPKGFSLGCTNLTGPVGSQKIKKGDTAEYYNTCPTPRSPCETSLCTSEGKCVVVLSPSSTCASNADCATQFDDSSVACDTDTCSCVAPPCCDWIDFQPASYDLETNTVVNESASSFKWRRSATHIEINGRIEFQNIYSGPINVVVHNAFNTIDISNIGINLLSTGTYWGTGGGGMMCQNNSTTMTNNEIYSIDATDIAIFMRFTTPGNNTMCSFSFFYYSILQ